MLQRLTSETEAAKATLQATERLRSRAVFLSGLVAPFRRAFRFVGLGHRAGVRSAIVGTAGRDEPCPWCS